MICWKNLLLVGLICGTADAGTGTLRGRRVTEAGVSRYSPLSDFQFIVFTDGDCAQCSDSEVEEITALICRLVGAAVQDELTAKGSDTQVEAAKCYLGKCDPSLAPPGRRRLPGGWPGGGSDDDDGGRFLEPVSSLTTADAADLDQNVADKVSAGLQAYADKKRAAGEDCCMSGGNLSMVLKTHTLWKN